MLLHLNIKNFAIVKALNIDWQSGMTTITGETGAGKSIAIDALGLCLGERALNNVVRPGAQKAELAATFDIGNNEDARNWLAKNDLEQEHECILRRVVSAEGRSKAYINGAQVPLAQLREIGSLLINIHGQHDHQLIVKASQQRKLLDEYANHADLLDDVGYQYIQWQKLTAELSTLQNNQLQREAKRQLLQYQVNELNEFNLQVDEFETLEADYKRYSHAQQLINESLHSLDTLSQNEQFNVVDSLMRTQECISQLTHLDQELESVASLLNEALIQIEEANRDLQHYVDRLELDPNLLADLEERYSLAIQLAKKHQVKPERLASYHHELTSELAAICSDENRLDAMIDEIANVKQRYHGAAQSLSDSRQLAGIKLSELISVNMQELNMPYGKFSVHLSKQKSEQLSPYGFDEIGFLVSINPGQPMEAMNKVASGGELSRIGLAMQVILAEKVITPTLIFDEVDVGISGPTASMVGTKLRQLGQNTQVICVTHLPQVACKGHQQLFVTKLTDGEHTETKVTELNAQGRVREIARLLAGDKITDNSLASAEELLAG